MSDLVLGGYSYKISQSGKFYENFFDDNVVPLLKLLYENEQYKLTLSLTSAEIDWMVEKRSEAAKLLSILLKRGSVSLLSSTLYESFVPIATIKEVSDQLESMRVKIRQAFRYKASGFFVFNGVWQTELVKSLSKADITHVVVPCNINKNELSSSFLTCEHGNKMLILTSKCYNINSIIDGYLESKYDFSKLNVFLSKHIALQSREEKQVLFFNIDKFVEKQKSFFEFIKFMLDLYSKSGYKPITSEDVSCDNISYLPSGCYYDEKFLSRLYTDKKDFMKIARINYVENLISSKVFKKPELTNVANSISKLYSGVQFLPEYSSDETDKEIYKAYLDVVNDIADSQTQLLEFDMLTYTLNVIKDKNNLFLLDQKCASIREVGDFKTGVNLLSSARLLEDVISIKQKKDKKTYHSYNQFDVVDSKSARSSKMYHYFCSNFCDINVEIDKTITIKNSKEIDLVVILRNNNPKRVDFTYSLLCSFDNIKDVSTLEKCNTIFNVYLDNDTKKAITFTSEPGFYISSMKKNSLLPSWDVSIETGKSFKVDFKITF